jgi:hypothetical protein
MKVLFTSFAHFEAKVATRSAHRRSHGKGIFVGNCKNNVSGIELLMGPFSSDMKGKFSECLFFQARTRIGSLAFKRRKDRFY